MIDVRQFGAVDDGATLSTAAIQAAIDVAAGAGGGTVIVPAGRYVTGALQLRSRITLHLEAGATLLGSENPDDFPLWASEWEGPDVKRGRRPLVGGEGLHDIAVTGRGVIDGRGDKWWALQKARPGVDRRPMLFRVVDCRNVHVTGVTFQNSPIWTVSPLACDNVVIQSITVRNPADSPNTDGINPDSCRNVRISDCLVDVGDDCITIKSGKEDDGRQELRPCENITVTNCVLSRGHGGVVIGSEISGGVRNVTISNCVFVGTDRGIRLKARRGRGGIVENVAVSNLVMDDVGAAVTMNLFYGCGAWNEAKVTDAAAHPVDAMTPRFRRLRFSQILASNVRWAGIYVLGLPEMPIEDVSFHDLSLNMHPDSEDAQPPVMAPNVAPANRRGVILRHANKVRLSAIGLAHVSGPPLEIGSTSGVRVSGISSAGESPNALNEELVISDQ